MSPKSNNMDSIKKAKSSRYSNLKKLLSFCRPESTRIYFGFAALIANAITNLGLPWILGQAVDQKLLTSSENHMQFLLGTGCIFVVASLSSFIRIYCLGTASQSIASRMKLQLFKTYIDKDVDFFDEMKKGQILSVLSKDVMMATEVLTEKLASGLRSLNSAVNGSILLCTISPFLFSISISALPIVGIGSMQIAKKGKLLAEKLRQLESSIITFAIERFHSITTIRLNGRESYENESFAKFNEEFSAISNENILAKSSLFSFINFSTSASLLAVLYVGGNMLRDGKLTTGELTKFALQSVFVGLGFSGLAAFYDDMTKGLDATDRVFDVLESHSDNDSDTGSQIFRGGKVDAQSLTADAMNEMQSTKEINSALVSNGNIEFNSVSFVYRGRNDPLLDRISLYIESNSITAIAGQSGSGKSTCMALITGLYKASSGSVLLGGVDINHMNLRHIRRYVGVVEQSAGLLGGSIFDNIAYGKDGVVSMDEVVRAAKLADAHDFICQMSEGYNTKVGETGSNLSGGQKARIAIARALVRDPKYLLLDEATSSLDKASEYEIVATLRRLSQQKTVVVFTHSEVMMKSAKIIFVLKNGSVMASGSYSDLQQTDEFSLSGLI